MNIYPIHSRGPSYRWTKVSSYLSKWMSSHVGSAHILFVSTSEQTLTKARQVVSLSELVLSATCAVVASILVSFCGLIWSNIWLPRYWAKLVRIRSDRWLQVLAKINAHLCALTRRARRRTLVARQSHGQICWAPPQQTCRLQNIDSMSFLFITIVNLPGQQHYWLLFIIIGPQGFQAADVHGRINQDR